MQITDHRQYCKACLTILTDSFISDAHVALQNLQRKLHLRRQLHQNNLFHQQHLTFNVIDLDATSVPNRFKRHLRKHQLVIWRKSSSGNYHFVIVDDYCETCHTYNDPNYLEFYRQTGFRILFDNKFDDVAGPWKAWDGNNYIVPLILSHPIRQIGYMVDMEINGSKYVGLFDDLISLALINAAEIKYRGFTSILNFKKLFQLNKLYLVDVEY